MLPSPRSRWKSSTSTLCSRLLTTYASATQAGSSSADLESVKVVVVDKAFVEALIAAKGLFKPVAGPIVGLLKTQIGLINVSA